MRERSLQAPAREAPPAAEDIASYLHTGGTTGTPKLAARTHANEVSNAWMIRASNILDQSSVIFAALPLFHTNALVVTVLGPLLKGQHVVWGGPLGYRDVPLSQNFCKIVERYRIAAMSGVPTVYAVLAQVPVDADAGPPHDDEVAQTLSRYAWTWKLTSTQPHTRRHRSAPAPLTRPISPPSRKHAGGSIQRVRESNSTPRPSGG